jgi:hypothetical protein
LNSPENNNNTDYNKNDCTDTHIGITVSFKLGNL